MLIFALHVILIFGVAYGGAYYVSGPRLRAMIGPRFAICFIVLAMSGFVVPTAPIFFLLCIVMFVATVRDRQDAICRYLLLNLLLPAIDWPVTVHGSFLGSYSTDSALLVGALISFLIKPGRPRTMPVRGFKAEDMLVAVMMLIFVVGATRFPSVSDFGRSLIDLGIALLGPYLLFRREVRTPEEWRMLLGCMAAGSVILAVCAVVEARLGWALFDMMRMSLSAGAKPLGFGTRGGALRAAVSMSGPLVLALVLMVGLIATVCSRSEFSSKLTWRGAIAVILLGILSCQSRGTLLALVPALIVLFITTRRFANAVILSIVAVVGGSILYVGQNFSPRIAAFMGSDQRIGQYYDYRQLLFDRGMQEGMKHPLLGQPMATVLNNLADITQGERIVDLVNTYLTIFLISGLAGLLAFVALLLVVGRKLLARARRRDDIEAIRAGRAFLLAAMSGYLVNIFSMSFIDRVPYLLMLMLAGSRLIATSLVKAKPKSSRAGPPGIGRPLEWPAAGQAGTARPAPDRALAPSG